MENGNWKDGVICFFEKSNKKTNTCFWRLHGISKLSHKTGSKTLKASNFNSSNLEESIEELEDVLSSNIGKLGPKYFRLKHYSSATDPSPEEFDFVNPYHNPSHFSNSVGSFGGNNYNMNMQMMQQMLMMQKESSALVHGLEMKLQQSMHEREMERKDEAIEGLQNSTKTLIDSVKGLLETEVGKMVSSAVIGVITARLMGGGQQVPATVRPMPATTTVIETTNDDDQPTTEDLQSDMQSPAQKSQQQAIKEYQDRLTKSITTMQPVFGEDFLPAMESLAVYCANNPEMAKAMLLTLNQQNGASSE